MYYVYVLKSLKNGRYYIGYSQDPEKRLLEHNLGKTKGNYFNVPFELAYKESYDTLTEAKRRESYIKSQKSSKFIDALILNDNKVLLE